ncbi:ABC transporter substrate-binding protein [Zavarzinia compransoris]|uniref:ABC transporter substrate-binding protein n=2 Tax=Zavarzinia compransoris TaxID=1264899 RepID=A0A317E9X2_9PROT|nr:ABC transporter substrate-binding protein [Zavarzinia compransoris]
MQVRSDGKRSGIRSLAAMTVAAAALAIGFGGQAQAAKTLVYCSEGSPENFNPQLNTTGTSFDAARPVYDRLVDFVPGTTETRPGLAESWSVSADGLTYEFKLRRGVKFHTGKTFTPTRDFNADDVLFSFNRMWKKDHPYHGVSGGAYDYFGDMGMADMLASIDKVDDYTVRFVLTKPNAPFIANLAMDFATILSAEYADALLKAGTPEKLDQEPIGTGAFSFVQYQKDAIIRFKANDAYWAGKPKLDSLIFAITPDASTRWAKLKAGECHIAPYPNPQDLETMKATPGVTLMQQPGLNVGYLAFNTEKPPFDRKEVRQALSMAIDKAAIIKAVYGAAGQPAVNPIPPTIWSYNKSIADYPYDPAKAKELLAAAGVTGEIETDIWAMPVQRPYNPDAKKIAELIQADLAQVGFKAKIVTYEWGEYRKRCQNGEHQMCQLGWTGDNGDPDNFLYTLLGCDAARPGGGNLAKWCNKDFDALVRKAQAVSDIAERTKLYEQAQAVFHEDAPWFVIAHSVVSEPVSDKVVNYKISPLGSHEFKEVDMK